MVVDEISGALMYKSSFIDFYFLFGEKRVGVHKSGCATFLA
jgi:hypothetical protein